MTDSEVSRNEGESLNEVVTTAANDNRGRKPDPRGSYRVSACALATILWRLAQQLRLEGEDVVENTIDAPAFKAVVGDHPGPLEVTAQRSPKRSVDPRSPAHLRLLEQLKAAVQRELAQPVPADAHVPSTSTLPAAVTLALTTSRAGRW